MNHPQEFDINQIIQIVSRWGKRLLYTFSDQFIFSLSSFVLNMVLGRWMPTEDYGAYALGYSVFLFIISIPSSIIWEPMAVLGVARDKSEQPNYFHQLLILQISLIALISLVLAIISLFISGKASISILSVSIAMPFMLLLWFSRQIFYLHTKPRDSLKVSVLYLFLQLGGIGLMLFSRRLSVPNVFTWTAFSSLIAFLYSWKLLVLFKGIHLHISELWKMNTIFTHWSYGKWILIAGLASGVGNLGFIPLLSIFSSLENVAVFKAMQNFVYPVNQVLTAMSLVLLPLFSRKAVQLEGNIPKQEIYRLLIVTIVISLSYFIFLIVFGDVLIKFIYQNPLYDNYSWLLVLMGISTVITIVGHVFRIFLRAVKKPEAIFWSKAFPALFVILFGVLLVWQYGILGAVISMIISALLEALLLIYFFFGYSRNKQVAPQTIVQIPMK